MRTPHSYEPSLTNQKASIETKLQNLWIFDRDRCIQTIKSVNTLSDAPVIGDDLCLCSRNTVIYRIFR